MQTYKAKAKNTDYQWINLEKNLLKHYKLIFLFFFKQLTNCYSERYPCVKHQFNPHQDRSSPH